jgi:hypothetical protein
VTIQPVAPGSSAPTGGASNFQPGVPVPSIGTNVSVCGMALPGAVGGQTITDPTGALRITLTEGGNYSYGPPRASLGQPALAVCHQQSNSTVVISTVTGRELARTVRDSFGRSVMDRILAGAQLTGAAAPAGLLPGAAGTSGLDTGGAGVLRPPSTGDGGLR